MGKIGYGYGSEWHFLRYLGYHRSDLSEQVLTEVNGDKIHWLDFPYTSTNRPLLDDREFVGIEFIDNDVVKTSWKNFWPQTGRTQNWDGIAQVTINGQKEWLLIEAKAHIGEVQSSCGATSPKSIAKIRKAFEETSFAFENQTRPIDNWLSPYYQYSNRLSMLYFLMNKCTPTIPTRLLFVYFYGENMQRRECPQNKEDWQPTINEIQSQLGINKNCALGKRIHHLFLPISPFAQGNERIIS